MQEGRFVGHMEGGIFREVDPEPGNLRRLTRVGLHALMPPEGTEIDLSPYEGKMLVVRGIAAGDWIFSAEILEENVQGTKSPTGGTTSGVHNLR